MMIVARTQTTSTSSSCTDPQIIARRRRWCFINFLLGLALYVTGFASPYWFTADGSHYGLWRMCLKDTGCFGTTGSGNAAWFVAVQSMMSLGLFALVGTFLSFLACLCSGIWQTRISAHRAATAFLFIATGLSAIGVIVFGATQGRVPTGWAYWVSVASIIHLLLCGVTMSRMPQEAGPTSPTTVWPQGGTQTYNSHLPNVPNAPPQPGVYGGFQYGPPQRGSYGTQQDSTGYGAPPPQYGYTYPPQDTGPAPPSYDEVVGSHPSAPQKY